jgi:hypothetical protein
MIFYSNLLFLFTFFLNVMITCFYKAAECSLLFLQFHWIDTSVCEYGFIQHCIMYS